MISFWKGSPLILQDSPRAKDILRSMDIFGNAAVTAGTAPGHAAEQLVGFDEPGKLLGHLIFDGFLDGAISG